MKCKKCGSENLGVMFDVIVSAPIKYYYNFSKQAMRDKGVRLWGADWHKADIVCGDCYYSTALNKNAATNADRIRSMTDEELAELLARLISIHVKKMMQALRKEDCLVKEPVAVIENPYIQRKEHLDWLKAETEGEK